MKTRVIFAACTLLALPLVMRAQDQSTTLQAPAPRPSSTSATRLVLEVLYNAALPPAYIKVASFENKPNWIWVTKFVRSRRHQPQPDELPIRAVRIESQWNGETAEVRVTLLRGVEHFDQEVLVERYAAGLDETKFVKKLEDHGIEPFKITLRIPRAVSPPHPGLVNRTRSIQVVKIETEDFPLPAYRVTFKNLSDKNLAALKVELFRDGVLGLTTFLQGEDGSPRIVSNAVREEYIPANVQKKNRGVHIPGSPTVNSIAIVTAVFTDGTFEGELGHACRYESFVVGRRAALKSALKLIDEHLNQPEDESQAALLQFKEKVLTLGYEFTDAEKAAASVVSPGCPNPALAGDLPVKTLRLQLLRELDPIITTRPRPLPGFKTWLESRKQKYQLWLKNLETFVGPPTIATKTQ